MTRSVSLSQRGREGQVTYREGLRFITGYQILRYIGDILVREAGGK